MITLLLSTLLLADRLQLPDPTRELQAARYALEIELRPAEAASRLRELLARVDLSRTVRARARLELARCELLTDDLSDARSHLLLLAEEPEAVRAGLPGIEVLRRELEALSQPPPPVDVESAPPASIEVPVAPAESVEPAPPAEPVERSVFGAQLVPSFPGEERSWNPSYGARDLSDLLLRLDDRAELWRRSLEAWPDAGQVAAVVARRFARNLGAESKAAYTASTYSFEHATRDNRRRAHNDWDFEFGNSGSILDVRTVVVDRSTIRDLGPPRLEGSPPIPPSADSVRIDARPGHVFLIHTLDRDTDRWFEMQVLEIREAQWMVFRWVEIEGE